MNSGFSFQRIKQPMMSIELKSGKKLLLLTPSLSIIDRLQDAQAELDGASGVLPEGVSELLRTILSCNKGGIKISKEEVNAYTIYEFIEFLQSEGGYMDFLLKAIKRPE